MAALPEDDSPTMSGVPDERLARHVGTQELPDSDNTAAQSEPPAHRQSIPGQGSIAPPDESNEPHGADEEDRTVQQAPQGARRPPPSPAAGRPPAGLPVTPQPSSAAMPSAVPSTASSPSLPSMAAGGAIKSSPSIPSIPSTMASTVPGFTAEPRGGVVSSGPSTRPASGSTTAADEIEAHDLTDDATEDLDDEDELEDSITATAPRISSASFPITMQGSVEIRTAIHDELLDETEIRTRPGNIPLNIPPALRAQMAGQQPSQPPPPPRPAAGMPATLAVPVMTAPRAAEAADTSANEDNDDDGVTSEALAPRLDSVPDFGAPLMTTKVPSTERSATAPAKDAFTSLPRDLEINTSPGVPPTKALVAPAAIRPIAQDNDELLTRPGVEGERDDPPTRPGVEGADEPPTRPGLVEPETRPGIGVDITAQRAAADSYANEDDDDEGDSITKRGTAVPTFEDSVTTQNAPVPEGGGDSTLYDGTDGTTKRVKKPRLASPASPADGESESITTQAPGPLTNILRVIASDGPPAVTPDEGIAPFADDEPPENRTAVMVNAPLKRIIAELTALPPLNPIRPTGPPISTQLSAHGPMGSAAPRLEPSSESGLRARAAAREHGSGERASLGALGIPSNDARPSGIARSAHHSENRPSMGPMDVRDPRDMGLAGFTNPQPSVHDVDLGKSPRYGALVAVVAVMSIIVPLMLFLMLNRSGDPPPPERAAEPVSDLQKRDVLRAKAERGKNGLTIVPPQPSASGSARKRR